MKRTLTQKIKRAKEYIEFLYQDDNLDIVRDELIKDVKASVFLSLNEAVIKKYLETQNVSKTLEPFEQQCFTRAEFAEFVAYICMQLQREVDEIKINTKVKLGSK